jgi:hypothetical protein
VTLPVQCSGEKPGCSNSTAHPNSQRPWTHDSCSDSSRVPLPIQSLLREVERKKRGGPAPAEASEEGEDITPEMGFVIKTHDDTGRKVSELR